MRHGHRLVVELDIDEKRVPHCRHLITTLMFRDVEDELLGGHVRYSPFAFHIHQRQAGQLLSRSYRGLISSSIVLAL